MLVDDSIRPTPRSAPLAESGMCTPSGRRRSRVEGRADEPDGIGSPSLDQHRLERWIPRRLQRRPRLSRTGCSLMTSSRCPHLGCFCCSTISLGLLDGRHQPALLELAEMNGLNSSRAIILGQPALVQLQLGADHALTERPSSRRACPSRFWREAPCLPLRVSDSDFSGRLFARAGRARGGVVEQRVDASCSIRFSLRMMNNGGPSAR